MVGPLGIGLIAVAIFCRADWEQWVR